MNKFISLCLVICIAFTSYGLYQKQTPIVKTDTNIHLNGGSFNLVQYENTESNGLVCDLDTTSMIVKGMLADGFTLEDEESTEEYICMTLARDDIGKFKIKWDVSGTFTSIGVPYEKSYLPITYINKS